MAAKRQRNFLVGGVIIALVAALLWQGGLFSAADSPASATPAATPTATTLQGCSVEDTTLTYQGFDKLQAGTSVTVTARTSVNSGTFETGITSASPGDTLEILLINGTTYHNAKLSPVTTPCKGTLVIGKGVDGYDGLKQNGTLTVTVFNTNGDAVAGPASDSTVNVTATSGATHSLAVRLDGQDRRATNDLRCVFEATNKDAVRRIGLNGFGAVEVPGGQPRNYSVINGSSETWVYDIQELSGSVSPSGVISLEQESGQSAAGSRIIIRCMSKEWFRDTDGIVKYGVENADGILQSLLFTNRSVTIN